MGTGCHFFSGLRMRRIYSILPRLNGAVFKNCAVSLTRVFRKLVFTTEQTGWKATFV